MNQFALEHIVDSAYCFPISDKKMVIRLRTARDDVDEVYIVYESKYQIDESQKKAKMFKTLTGHLYDYYSITLELTDTRLAYVFYINDKGDYFYFSEDGATKEYDFTKGYYNFFQYPYINHSDILERVDWLTRAEFYQIFADRFRMGDKDKNKDYINLCWGDIPKPASFAGGDLRGVIDKLDYIQDLGCDALYLTPIFKSPSNHKYDTVDYFEIDEQFGNKQDLKQLVDDLHSRGMRLVLDAVFNHTSELNEKFQDVVKNGISSRYHDWFVIDGDFPVKEPLNYEVFAGCPYMPKWNTSNEEVQDYLISIATYYINEFNIDGWRLDVSDEISHAFWRYFRKEVKKAKKEAVIIGENWHDASNYLRGDQFDSIMNYSFTKACLDYFAYDKFDASAMADKLNDILARNTDTVNDMMMNLLDSHDTDRFYSEVGEDKIKLHAALCLLYLFPGTPSIFYGTECYMPGGYDPDCRRCMDWDSEGRNMPVRELIKNLADIRRNCDFIYEGTKVCASADRRLLIINRHGIKADAKLLINMTSEVGCDGSMKVKPFDYRIFVDGGEIIC